MDPYDVLGVSKTASLGEVRSRYFELAKEHHPDKLHNITAEEKIRHEEIFKNISVAYSTIERTKNTTSSTSTKAKTDETINPDDWRTIWNELEVLVCKPGIWDTMKGIVKDTIKDVAVKGLQKFTNQHFIKVPVTLEEVHAQKKKRIRLFLHKVDEPVYITVDLSEFPSCEVNHTLSSGLDITITIEFTLQDHDVYKFDDVLDSWDLFASVKITWMEYIEGKMIIIPYIDGSDIYIVMKPFTTHTSPIMVEGKGLCSLGNLYASVEVLPPVDKNKWDALSSHEKETTLKIIQQLY